MSDPRIDAVEARLSQVEKRQALADEYNSWLLDRTRAARPVSVMESAEKWYELRAAHGVAPFEEPRAEGLKYGAEIVQLGPQACPFEPRTKTHYLDMYGGWNARGFMEDVGQFKTYDAAISALALAPPPPGWVDTKDAPPPEPAGQPLAAPKPEAGEGDGMEDRASFAFAKYNDSAVGQRSINTCFCAFARSEVARATASLRAEVEAQKQRADAELAEVKALCERVKDQNVKLAAALTNKLEAWYGWPSWSKDPRTVRLCRIMAKAGIRYDYGEPVPPRVKVKAKPTPRTRKAKRKAVRK